MKRGVLFSLLFGLSLLVGCGPTEKAADETGAAVKAAAEDVKDAGEAAVEDIKDAGEAAGEKIEEAVDDAKEDLGLGDGT